MTKFLLATVASFGITYMDLPKLLAYMLVVMIFSAIIRWKKDKTWKKFFGYIAFAEFIGILVFGATWADLPFIGSLPLPAIGAIVGVLAAQPKELLTKITNFKLK